MSGADAAGCRDARQLADHAAGPQSAKAGFAFPITAVSSGARSIGIVVTAMAPVFMTASQAE